MEFIKADGLVAYQDAHDFMEQRVADIRNDEADEALWLLEHPALYTAGTSAQDDDLLDARFPGFKTGRGGQYTYHGPGQRIGYVMLDLKRRQSVPDIKKYICDLEEWIIRTIAQWGIIGERREGRVGIWVDLKPYGRSGEAKIAAIGVRIRRWVTFHGLSLNLNPVLENFEGIVPCGLAGYGVTSFADLGVDYDEGAVDAALHKSFAAVFGGT